MRTANANGKNHLEVRLSAIALSARPRCFIALVDATWIRETKTRIVAPRRK
jgi:hypothetical protein